MTDHASAPAGDSTPPKPEYPLLAAPKDGVPEVIESEPALDAAAQALAGADGPVAVDAERASGFRYGNRAYLVQLRREGAGSFLIDPIACPDLSPIQDALGDAEWVLHAATQDLPCLAEVGLHPTSLFDTELGSRLAGLPRVGLAAVVEHYLGVTLAKEHSAVDWSERPFPQSWLTYAALDVEVLIQVRDALAADLQQQGKGEWAAQEFAALTHFTAPVREEPWRRTSGMHRTKNRRAVARVRELWLTRDALAQQRDTAPGRVLPDALLVELANKDPKNAADLAQVRAAPPKGRSGGRPHPGLLRHRDKWLDALRRAGQLPDKQLPAANARTEGPPPARAWADRDPVAAARLSAAREALAGVSEERQIPVENLLTPDTLRRVLWLPPEPLDAERIRRQLADLGARPWQVEIATPIIADAVSAHLHTSE